MDILASSLAAAQHVLLAPSAPRTPDRLATERFAAVMQQPAAPTGPGPGPGTVAPPSTDLQADNTVALTSPENSASVGDRILSGIQSVSGDFQTAWKAVAETVSSDQMTSMQDMLRLQLQLAQVTVQYDLVGKAISRSTQNFDQLVRVQ